MLKIVSGFVACTLWLMIAFFPALFGVLLAGPVCLLLDDLNLQIVLSFSAIGLVVGTIIAERIRAGVGLFTFWGKLVANPELDRY
ncbi:hypothetical protein [Photobacterium sp. 1_MG-2023]|uniref:hypothetical protein n=1 Tax=Photobacterium sp. 1_MG-2023 TaxID=3062646 RepID=UPI0026E225DF|nr:hypothetical protein [Photobacterium sp. 1_MG-2023]MDO6707270.1 hypothetical protein [Photobacterium sp. 1_MG-2023]